MDSKIDKTVMLDNNINNLKEAFEEVIRFYKYKK